MSTRPIDEVETDRVLEAAQQLILLPRSAYRDSSQLEAFVEAYRNWITAYHDAVSPHSEHAQSRMLLLHCMCGASTLQEALALVLRFSRTEAGPRGIATIDELGESVALVLDQPLETGASAFIADFHLLSMTLCEIEFLLGGPVEGVEGEARSPQCLPEAIAHLLFDRPYICGSPRLALRIPRKQLGRAVTARTRDIADFLARSATISLGVGRSPANVAALVQGLLRRDRLRRVPIAANLEDIARRMGYSAVQLRRRLRDEGTGFWEIKEAVIDEVAKTWLGEMELSMGTIAERLGYSDIFAFQRSFRRRNGYSPSTFRREIADRSRRS